MDPTRDILPRSRCGRGPRPKERGIDRWGAPISPFHEHSVTIAKLVPTLYAVVSSLPRGARVEKQVVVHSGRFVTLDARDHGETDEVVVVSPEFIQGTARSSRLHFLKSSTCLEK